MNSTNHSEKDYLWLQIREMPYFRGLLRAVEARFYKDIQLTEPTLDLGCGDGHFATIAFDRELEVGVDPWWAPIQEAKGRNIYNGLAQSDGAAMPFPTAYFRSAVSNSVLEHIPHIDAVLEETGRVLEPGALFIFCVPNHNFLSNLSISSFLDRIHLKSLGDLYRRFFNRISRHHHCDPPDVWAERLERAGFTIEKYWHYFSPDALCTLEWGHYLGLPSLVAKTLTGRWVLNQSRWNLGLTYRSLEKHYREQVGIDQGSYSFYIARRTG